MATTMAAAMSLTEALGGLAALEFDAAAAYEAAIQRLDDPIARDRLGGFMGDHLRHIQELSAILREMGQPPPLEADLKAVLTQGKVVIGGLVGMGCGYRLHPSQ